ncbi:alanine racemase [Ureibacillus sinduriensis]|uniref:Alanine racemase n=1 Tax=Ureibacillus sinduriensis BLB-1 = JCM 15800 TaxID=1384057 RepID=A0A0A3HST6_9BACL|nr:alanine racemase [Ureibacillus sinduriensis]KGR75504.1 alanine racemase [Ureibacillus sinduriensis BLB-1 = JCM 15800]
MQNIKHFRPTKAIINLDAIKHNVNQLKEYLNPGVQIMAVVKANAYGHGDIEVAAAAIEAGATVLAVATPEEALHLREAYRDIDILILGYVPVSFAPLAAVENITLTVFSTDWVEQVNTLTFKHPLKVHIKVDTGMGRIGVTNLEDLQNLYHEIVLSEKLLVDGIFTHFATADEEDETYFLHQVTKFEEFLRSLPKRPRLVHAANTATMLVKDQTLQYDAVRFGISMYGLAPSAYVKTKLPFPLQPAFSLETELIEVKEVQAGQSIGYGAAFTASEPSFIGTIPIGYADGLIRKYSGQHVLIDGVRVPIIGRICMDQCMLLLPIAYNIGKKVTLIGKQEDEEITIDEWAKKGDTINYEVPCIITSRVPRIYYKK